MAEHWCGVGIARNRPGRNDRAGSYRRRVGGATLVGVGLLMVTGCGDSSPSTLSPEGPSARRVSDLWWLLFGISVVVALVVFAIMTWALLRRRGPDVTVRYDSGHRFVIVMGALLPAVVLTAVYLVGLRDMHALQADDEPVAYSIDVVGHKWWWEVRYVEDDVTTANEIHIPAGEPVELKLTTDDVNHSLWVPQLAPKTDLIAGRVNTMRLEADAPGIYRGQCAEYCGIQHGNMAFTVVAHPPEEFESWLATSSSPAPEPTTEMQGRGLRVFESSSCASCHTVRGTEADGDIGPDLTHVASREEIGAGALQNTPEHLAEWISNAQSVKPGNQMPPQPLSQADREALVEYLGTLE